MSRPNRPGPLAAQLVTIAEDLEFRAKEVNCTVLRMFGLSECNTEGIDKQQLSEEIQLVVRSLQHLRETLEIALPSQ